MKKAESLQDFLTSEGYIKVQMKRSVAGHFEIDAEVERIAAFCSWSIRVPGRPFYIRKRQSCLESLGEFC
ncbi:MAG: hypothetical protein E2O77_08930 [Caldithrix sp.]|nr:MAG: hypothetical protein E2O77_08930 [Caldithrix sp.]